MINHQDAAHIGERRSGQMGTQFKYVKEKETESKRYHLLDPEIEPAYHPDYHGVDTFILYASPTPSAPPSRVVLNLFFLYQTSTGRTWRQHVSQVQCFVTGSVTSLSPYSLSLILCASVHTSNLFYSLDFFSLPSHPP